MATPSTIKNMNLFVDGVGYLGEIDEVTLPTLARKMDEHRGGGMDAPIDIDMGQEKLEAEFKAKGQIFELLDHYGICDPSGLRLRFTGAVENDSSACGVDTMEVIMLGRYNELSTDTVKPGEPSPSNYKLSLGYYKLTVNDQDKIEIDPANFIFKVNGVDRLAEQRKALGI